MKLFEQQAGFTLIEVMASLAIAGSMVGMLAGVIAIQTRLPVKARSEQVASQQVQRGVLLITEDASRAQSFAAGADPDYGTFSWFEFSGVSPISTTARYFWEQDPSHPDHDPSQPSLYGKVLRELNRNGEVTPPQVVLTGIVQYGSVTFDYVAPAWSFDHTTKLWSYTEGQVDVNLTTTHEAGVKVAIGGEEFPDTIVSAQLFSDLRPQPDLPAPLPARLPPPAPLPNQINFRIAGEPVLLKGTIKSGSGADLTFDDANFYKLSSSNAPRTASYEATSEVIDYSDIEVVTIEFTGQSNKAGSSLEVFVFNPTDQDHTDGGYDTSADVASVFSSSGTDTTVTFSLSPNDLNYVNSLNPKVIRIKVKATHSTKFDFSSDKLVYTVAGTPASTFFRDYLAITEPSLEVGSLIGGSVASLETDDTDYYTTQEVGDVLQWTTTSEAITLDTIGTLEVIFTGRATKGAPVQEIFVFNPANGGDGFASTPDSSFTYTSTGTDATVSFFVSGTDLTYIASLFPKEVRIRIKGTDTTANWQLQADKLVFRAKP